MADNISIFEQLKADNPFASSASPLPWENNTPDVLQLNSVVSAEIEQLIRNKRLQPSLPLSGLIFGGAGMGKTHMLARILRKLRKNAWQVIFVAVRSLTNPKMIMQEILSEIFICMTQTHSNGRSQFDVLMSAMMDVFHERRREDGFSITDTPNLKTYLKHDMPRIDRVFLKCILLYLGTNDKTIKDEIIEWLREGLDDEDSLKLGLPLRDVNSMDDEACESAAKNIITSLGILLSYARIPMLICFDDLETMKNSNELISAWGGTIAFLMNATSGILPLCFVRRDIWDSKFLPVLDMAIVQRLQVGKMEMNTCSVEQAKQIIHDRIASAFTEGVEEKYNWLISRIGVIPLGRSPRQVIELAKNALSYSSDPKEIVKEAYDDEYKKIQSEPRAWPPNASQINIVLEEWLKAHAGFELHHSKGKHIRICGTYHDRRYAFIVVVPKSHVTATAGVNEGIRFLEEYPGSFCCYVMETKIHKKTWKKFLARLDDFRAAGGCVAELDEDSRIQWYALTAAINQINNGNVNIYLPTGSRTATLADARDFLCSVDLVPGIFADSTAKTKPAQPASPAQPEPVIIVEPDILKVNLTSVIKGSPMKIIAAEKALALLAGRHITVSRNELLAFVNTDRAAFRLYPAKGGNDVMIGLVGRQ